MKNILKSFFIVVISFLLLPLITDAASISFENKQTKDNVVTYDIVYKPGDSPVDAVNLKITASNNNGILYNLQSSNSGGNNCNDLDNCTLVTALDIDTIIATLTITNTTEESQEISVNFSAESIEGNELNNGSIAVSLKAYKKTTTTTTTTTTTQRLKSDNSDLSNIKVSSGTLDQDYNKDTINYVVTGIKDTINAVTLTTTCDNYCTMNVICPNGECSISRMEKEEKDGKNQLEAYIHLQTGANQVFVISTSETGKNKTYTLNIYRGEIEINSPYLSSITINNAKLNEKFDPEITKYTTTVGKSVTSLDILPVTEDPEATYVIKNNKDFKEGENTVTITVTSSDGENSWVYEILVTKDNSIEDETTTTTTTTTTKVAKNEENNKKDIILIIVIAIIAIAIIIVSFIIIFKKKKKKNNNKKNNNKNNNNNNGTPKKEITLITEEELEKKEDMPSMIETPKKQNVDEALEDLMMTKRLELGELDI